MSGLIRISGTIVAIMLFTTLIFALIVVPLVEIYLLITVGRLIGVGFTILTVMLTAVLGASLLRLQGVQTLIRLRESLARGELPAVEIVAGLILLITGALLLTPGFFTDAVGFVCLIPAVRSALARWMLGRLAASGRVTMYAGNGRGSGRVIDGEFRREDEP